MSANSKTATLVKKEHVLFLSFFDIYFAFYIDDSHHVIRLLRLHLIISSTCSSKYIHHSYELAECVKLYRKYSDFFPPFLRLLTLDFSLFYIYFPDV